MRKLIILATIVLVAASFSKHATQDAFCKPSSWPAPVYNFKKNPLDREKIALGRQLFYDPVLSADSTISCASCHSPYNAFTHVDHKLSHGIGDQTGTRNAPVLINLAWSRHFMWDGSIRNLDEQAKVPICNPLEMNESISHVVNKLRQSKQYPGLFRSAFGDSAINETMILKSLSQFMLTLVSANAKYDRVMRHDEQFTEGEQKGYALFRSHCTACHTEPLFTHGGFENNGLMVDDELQDYGLMRITGKSTDSLRFKVPTLRNIEFSFPYMHDGRFKTLGQVLNNYMMGVQHGPTLSRHLQKGIYFTANQKADLIAFLLTLSDREFLFNPELGFPKK